MKRMIVIMAIAGALGAPGIAAAAEPTNHNQLSVTINSGTASTTHVQTNALPHRLYQWSEAPKLELAGKDKDQIFRVGGISSRPWAQTAGWPRETLFADESYYQPHFNLFWIGNRPQ